jgi:hypothetical protein
MMLPVGTDFGSLLRLRTRVAFAVVCFSFVVDAGLFAATTDFTWPDAVVTRETLSKRAAKARFFMFVLTLFRELAVAAGWGIQLRHR